MERRMIKAGAMDARIMREEVFIRFPYNPYKGRLAITPVRFSLTLTGGHTNLVE
jgi:hypothetical protein